MTDLTPLTPAAWGASQSPPVKGNMAAKYCAAGRLTRPDGSPGCYRLGHVWLVWPDAVVAGGRKAAGNPNWTKKENPNGKQARQS